MLKSVVSLSHTLRSRRPTDKRTNEIVVIIYTSKAVRIIWVSSFPEIKVLFILYMDDVQWPAVGAFPRV